MRAALEPTAKENCLLKGDEDFVDLEELSSQPESGINKGDATKECLSYDQKKDGPHTVMSAKKGHVQSAQEVMGPESDTELKGALDLETAEKQDEAPEVDKHSGSPENLGESTLNIHEDLDKIKLIEFYLNKNKEGSQLLENVQKSELSDRKSIEPGGIDITLSSSLPQAGDSPPEDNKEPGTLWVKGGETLPLKLDPSAEETVINNKEVLDSLGSSLDKMCHSAQMDNKSEIQLWLLKRIQVPIEGKTLFGRVLVGCFVWCVCICVCVCVYVCVCVCVCVVCMFLRVHVLICMATYIHMEAVCLWLWPTLITEAD
jgi:hypothetical protein